MHRLPKKIAIFALAGVLSFTPVQVIPEVHFNVVAEAHSGRTDSSGGHRDNKNKSGLGSYHYHCNGNPAHLHPDGTCPYSSKSTEKTGSKKTRTVKSSALVKKVQKKLNALGYDCGTADGIMGKKTKSALKEFQEDHDLKKDGTISKEVKKSLDL